MNIVSPMRRFGIATVIALGAALATAPAHAVTIIDEIEPNDVIPQAIGNHDGTIEITGFREGAYTDFVYTGVNDLDQFSFFGTEGDIVTISVNTIGGTYENGNFFPDPYVLLITPEGVEAGVEDVVEGVNFDSLISSFELTATTKYIVQVTHGSSGSASSFHYLATISGVTPTSSVVSNVPVPAGFLLLASALSLTSVGAVWRRRRCRPSGEARQAAV